MTKRAFVLIFTLFFPFWSYAAEENVSAPAEAAVTSCEAQVAGEAVKPADSEQNPSNYVVVLDTNVFISNPFAFDDFPNATIIVPMKVVEEIDRFKKEPDGRGKAARDFTREVAKMRARGSLLKGVTLKNGSIVKFMRDVDTTDLPKDLNPSSNDNQILAAALFIQKEDPNKKVALITSDVNMQIKADILELASTGYNPLGQQKGDFDLYTGRIERDATPEILAKTRESKELSWSELPATEHKLIANQFVVLNVRDEQGNVIDTLATRYDAKKDMLVTLVPLSTQNLPIEARSLEQEMALDILLNPDIKLITINGLAGSGKTLLAMVAAFHDVLWVKNPIYEEVMFARPMITMGKDPGALPGDLQQKMDPYMKAFEDNASVILSEMVRLAWRPERQANSKVDPLSKGMTNKEWRRYQKLADKAGIKRHDPRFQDFIQQARKEEYEKLNPPTTEGKEEQKFGSTPTSVAQIIKNKKVTIEALQMIRGRTLPNRYFIIDETQNLTQHEIKTIITRAGEGTKIILLGDIGQIDPPYLNAYNNGLSFVVENMKGEPISAHITLFKSERSELAAVSQKRLNRQSKDEE